MSKINIEGVVKNMNKKDSVYQPIIEAIVNSIEAIDENKNKNGLIYITFKRSSSNSQQKLIKGSKPASDFFSDVEISDNGIGLNERNLDAFDTLYTNQKENKGGKGFGRFTYIKFFKNVVVKSTYEDEDSMKKSIEFKFGKINKVVENPYDKGIVQQKETGTVIYLNDILKNNHFEKELQTIAKNILERILVYFVSYNNMPKIILKECGAEEIVLNNLFENGDEIVLKNEESFSLMEGKKKENFQIKVFKIFFPKSQKSKIVLTAHNREVTTTNLSEYITEFDDEFCEEYTNKKNKKSTKNYIIKAYVLGEYFDKNVDLERMSFEFEKKEKSLFHPFSQDKIENEVVKIIKSDYSKDLSSRRETKKQKVDEFLKKFHWYKSYKEKINFDTLPMKPSDEELTKVFHEVEYSEEKEGRRGINDALNNFDGDVEKKIENAFEKINEAKQSQLAHYLTLRKVYLDVFRKALAKDDDGNYKKENLVHDIIFPTKKDIDDVPFEKHNLWILDERLNFVEYLKSDQNFVEKIRKRADLVLYDREIVFGNRNLGNPVIVFEFKRPGMNNFITSHDKREDPHDQIVDYVKEMRKAGNIMTSNGRRLPLIDNTPFYGYIVADFSDGIQDWLKGKGYIQLPSGKKWSVFIPELKLYMEYLSWDQLLNDAEERNKIFFYHLGVDRI